MTINRPENLFDGVRPDQYRYSLRDFPEHAEQVARHVATMSPQDIEAGQRERTVRMIRLAELMTAGHPADAEPVRTEIVAQYWALTTLRPAYVEEYREIGRSCVDNPAWRSAYEAIAPGLAAFQRDAIEAVSGRGRPRTA